MAITPDGKCRPLDLDPHLLEWIAHSRMSGVILLNYWGIALRFFSRLTVLVHGMRLEEERKRVLAQVNGE
jgi:hypothetical protein